jgi:hypothetical protein
VRSSFHLDANTSTVRSLSGMDEVSETGYEGHGIVGVVFRTPSATPLLAGLVGPGFIRDGTPLYSLGSHGADR